MKLFIIIACFAAAMAAPSQTPESAPARFLPALQHTEVRDSKGQYDLSYITAEGTEVHEQGRLVSTPEGVEYMEVQGETRYIGTDGQLYVTKYTAGIDGAHMSGAHLPVPVVAEHVPQPAPAA